MSKFALYVPLEAKPGKEKEVADFLRSAIPLVKAEAGTISWFAIQMGHPPSPYSTRSTTKPGATGISTARWQRP